MIGKKVIPQWKLDEVKILVDLFKKHKNIAVIVVARVNDRQIQVTRKVLRNIATLKMSKKSLQLRAIEQFKKESKKKNLDELAKSIPGQSALLFTDVDIFEFKEIFEKNLWMVPPKPNEITPVDIWVPEGDTGLPTGQVISELNMTLRLPTKIQNDTIWIREDTKSHSAGDLVTIDQASVLKKLGVTPIESLIKIHIAWVDGELIPEDVLYMDMEQFQMDVASCFLAAKNLAIELGIIDDETIEPMIQKGYREALSLLMEMPIFDESLIEEYIKKASLSANMINMMVLGEGLPASTPVKNKEDNKSKDKTPDDDDDDEEESVGIGGLF